MITAASSLIGEIGSSLLSNLSAAAPVVTEFPAASQLTSSITSTRSAAAAAAVPAAFSTLRTSVKTTKFAAMASITNALTTSITMTATTTATTTTTDDTLNATTGISIGIGGNGGASNGDGPDDLIHNEFVQIFFCILYTTVFVLGVFGNVLVCYVVLRNRAMQTVTNIFITNLALSDILLCVLAVPFTPLYTFMQRWAFGRTLCHLVSFAQGCSIYISTLTLTSIAIDRYFVIIYPFHPRMKLSTCIAIIISIWVIALLATLPYGMYMKVVSDVVSLGNSTTQSNSNSSWINETTPNGSFDERDSYSAALHWNSDVEYVDYDGTATLENSPFSSSAGGGGGGRGGMGGGVAAAGPMSTTATEAYMQLMIPTTFATNGGVGGGQYGSNGFGSGPTVVKTYCEENWPSEQYRKVFGSVTTILQFVLPFIIISICYTWVSVKLNARARAKPGSKSSRREEADRDRKKRTNRMLIAMVAVFGLSWLPINVVNIFDDFYEKSNEWRFYTLFFFVAHSIAMSSTCYNPFLYAWLNENFRKEFKHVLPCFNPSNNNNIINIARGYNRSERNTCGPRLRHGSECGVDPDGVGGGGGGAGGGHVGNDDQDENGVTQETTCLPKDKLLIIPREPTYGNGSGAGPLSPQRFGGFGSGNSNANNTRHVEILLNESGCGSDALRASSRSRSRHRNAHREDLDEIDSGDEQTVEMRFCETPFVSSDNTTAISTLETSTSNEAERSGSGEIYRSGRYN